MPLDPSGCVHHRVNVVDLYSIQFSAGEMNHGTMPVSPLAVQKLWCHYVDILFTISHKEQLLTVICKTPGSLDKREETHRGYFF